MTVSLSESPRSSPSRPIFPVPKTVVQYSVQAMQQQIPVKDPQSTDQLEKYSSSVSLSSQLLPPRPSCVIPEAIAIVTSCNLNFIQLWKQAFLLAKPLAASLTLSFTGVDLLGGRGNHPVTNSAHFLEWLLAATLLFLSSYPFYRAAIPSSVRAMLLQIQVGLTHVF